MENNLLNKFLIEFNSGLINIHKFNDINHYYNNEYKIKLINELKNNISFYLNKNKSTQGLNQYLFYAANEFCKKYNLSLKKEYICPGCLFLGFNSKLECNVHLHCKQCYCRLQSCSDSKMKTFFECFANHNKIGYKCNDCKRFIPQPLNITNNIVCPYIDCAFVGNSNNLNKLRHPIGIVNYSPNKQLVNVLKEDSKYTTIHNVIESQKNLITYVSANLASKQKYLCYQAFDNLLHKYPDQMIGYLTENTRTGGFQAKVFQEYIRLLEQSFPFSYTNKKKIHTVNNLLDSNLNLFDGISTFENVVSDKLIINNATTEFYFGGRKAVVAKPYYIGKLLNIVDYSTKLCLLDKVREYSFLRIKMHDIDPGTKVIVTHLRVPPHYQMGGMVYVNRVRKQIIESLNNE